MMWFPVLILLISIGGSLCDDNEDHERAKCFFEKLEENCDRPKFEKFPGTPDELLAICQEQVAGLVCRLQAEEECGVPKTDEDRDAYNFTQTLCDKDNRIFKVISDNLQCIENFMKYRGLCGPDQRGKEKFIAIREQLNGMRSEDPEAAKCLDYQLRMSCGPILIGYTCNNIDVKEAVKEVGQYGTPNVKCTSESLEKVKSILQEYETFVLDEAKNYE